LYEPHSARLLTPIQFVRRLFRHAGLVAGLVGVSLLGGMIGYHWFAAMTWVDSFLNASMLLGGMGPIGELPNTGSKIFAGVFALYAGLVFIVSASILMAPIVHRVMHMLHQVEQGKRS